MTANKIHLLFFCLFKLSSALLASRAIAIRFSDFMLNLETEAEMKQFPRHVHLIFS